MWVRVLFAFGLCTCLQFRSAQLIQKQIIQCTKMSLSPFFLTWLQLFEQMLNHDFRLHIFCNITSIYWNGWICRQMGRISLIVAISFHVLIIDWFRYEQTLIILWPLSKITWLFGTLCFFFTDDRRHAIIVHCANLNFSIIGKKDVLSFFYNNLFEMNGHPVVQIA